MEERAERLYRAAKDDAGRRLDRVVRRLLPRLPLPAIYRAIRTGAIRVNGERVGPSHRVAPGDSIAVPDFVAASAAAADGPGGADAERLLQPLLVFANEHVLALNKPAGLPVHGPESAERLVSAYLASRLEPSLAFRPGPVHRLDRGTSGLLLFSCSLFGAQTLARVFRERAIAKEYLALVEGRLGRGSLWEDRLAYDHAERRARAGAGRPALMRVEPLATDGRLTLLACFPLTGRTHQIRAQAALRGHPLAGDLHYGGSRLAGHRGYLLHALALALREEQSGLGFRRLLAPLPEAFARLLERLLGPQAAEAARAEPDWGQLAGL